MNRRAASHDAHEIPPLEWAAAGLGLVLLLAAIAVILTSELRGGDDPPIIVLETRSVQASGDRWLVAFEARNDGDETAADLTISAELFVGDSAVESAESTIDHLPGNSRRRGGVFFSRDPRAGRVSLRPSGYREP